MPQGTVSQREQYYRYGRAGWAGVLIAGAGMLIGTCDCRAQGYVISTVAGGNPPVTGIGNGQPAVNASLNSPDSVAVDAAGNIYVGDTGDNMIRKISAATGIISAFAGTGVAGFSGDGGAAVNAQLRAPRAIALDLAGNLYIADTSNNRIRKVDTKGVITTVAGSSNTFTNGVGDGGLATGAALSFPAGIAVDGSGILYISDTGNRRVRKVDSGGTIITFAGTGRAGSVGSVGDGGSPTSAYVSPAALAFDAAGNLYIADSGNNLIRKVSAGIITSVAGTGNAGYSGDGSAATKATLRSPQGVGLDTVGNIIVTDTDNQVVRRVSSGNITTIAGNGGLGYYGDGGPAGAATLDYPLGIAVTASGLIYFANSSLSGYQDSRIRLLTPATGAVPTINSNGIVPVYNSTPSITTGSWISIYGSNLASATAVWNGDFPTVLGNTAVTIDSKPAYLWYVSPTQINAQVPDDSNTGSVTVAVTTPGGTTTQTVSLSEYAPSLSLFNATYPAAIVVTPGQPGNSGGGYDVIGPVGAFSFPTRPVSAGETLSLYGVGFGPTVPNVPAGKPFSGAAYLITVPNISIGDVLAEVAFAGMVQAGLYQFNVIVPDGLGSGDLVLQATVDGYNAQQKLYITVK